MDSQVRQGRDAEDVQRLLPASHALATARARRRRLRMEAARARAAEDVDRRERRVGRGCLPSHFASTFS